MVDLNPGSKRKYFHTGVYSVSAGSSAGLHKSTVQSVFRATWMEEDFWLNTDLINFWC